MHHRVIGVLAVTRSFGDHSYKRYVTAEPYIHRVELSSSSEFVVLACDGVFDVLSDSKVTEIVKREVKAVLFFSPFS